MNDAPILIHLSAIQQEYGRRRALAIDEFAIRSGEGVLLSGSNGSGKSTLLRILAGITNPKKGKADYRLPPSFRIGYVPQFGGLYADRTLRQNSRLLSRVCGRTDPNLDEVGLIDRVGLRKVLDIPVKELSGGFRRLAITSMVLASGPEALILDEPINALDPDHADLLIRELERATPELAFVIICGHESQGLSFLRRRVVLDQGHLVSDVIRD